MRFRDKGFRGQVSLEFLIVFSIFLSLLVVAVAAMVHLKNNSDDTFADSLAILASNDLSAAVNNVCVLGEGNSRAVDAGINGFSLEYDGTNGQKTLAVKYIYKNKEHSAVQKVKCPVVADESEYDRNIVVSYDSGNVVVTNS